MFGRKSNPPQKSYLPALGFVGVVVLVLGSLLSKILRVLTGPKGNRSQDSTGRSQRYPQGNTNGVPAATHSGSENANHANGVQTFVVPAEGALGRLGGGA